MECPWVDSLNFTWLLAQQRILLPFEVNRRKWPWPNWRYYSSMSLGETDEGHENPKLRIVHHSHKNRKHYRLSQRRRYHRYYYYYCYYYYYYY